MRLADAARPTFARHETFHPRYGWFRKAYSFAAQDSGAFTREDAPVLLGVGKNMVRSIRFWGSAANVITADPATNPRSPGAIPTRFSHALFNPDEGWDPYMEDPGTLWLLHWQLLAPPCQLPVWWVVFNDFHPLEFDEALLTGAVQAAVDAVPDWSAPNPSSMKKDVTALLRTYAPPDLRRRHILDDVLDCPLRELGLITRSEATGRYRFTVGARSELPATVVAACVFDYVARQLPDARTVTLAHLANEPGAPGRAFRLSETDLRAVLAPVADEYDDVSLTAPNQAFQLTWDGPAEMLGAGMLNDYYGRSPSDAVVGPSGLEPVDGGALDARSAVMLTLQSLSSAPIGANR